MTVSGKSPCGHAATSTGCGAQRPLPGRRPGNYGTYRRHAWWWLHHGFMIGADGSSGGSASPGKHSPGLAAELDKLIEDAGGRARSMRFYVRLWQVVDIIFGLLAATLAAVAGAAGLASTAGRVPAAILALCAAGFVAANQFLGSNSRFEGNRRRRNAWEVLEWDARAERAKLSESSAEILEAVMTQLLRRRIAILDMDHQAIPAEALGNSDTPRSG